ncbi:MAG: hypothetical protein Q7R80_04080 [bacterium]|nr:hypothetical protein [bacterium]
MVLATASGSSPPISRWFVVAIIIAAALFWIGVIVTVVGIIGWLIAKHRGGVTSRWRIVMVTGLVVMGIGVVLWVAPFLIKSF